jgi:hypothetical protein
MDTQVDKNYILIITIKGEGVSLGLYEAFLEAAPQFILQASIILRTGHTSTSFFIISLIFVMANINSFKTF